MSPTARRDPARLVDNEHRWPVVAQRQAAQHGRAVTWQADRQPAQDQLDLGLGLAPKSSLRSDEVAGELAEEKSRLAQRRRDHHGEAALQHGPGGLERGGCAFAALSRGIEQQARRSREQHIALPGIERQVGDALGPSDGVVERGGLRGFQGCERAAQQGQLALEGGGAHTSVACTRAMA